MGTHRSSATAASALVAGLALTAVTALAGCPTVDLGDTPTEIGLCNPAGGLAYFQAQIWPNIIDRGAAANSCAKVACHVGGGNGLEFPMTIDYPTAYKRTQIYLNCGSPEASLFLTKPLAGIDPHSGGDLFADMNDPAVQLFLAWFK